MKTFDKEDEKILQLLCFPEGISPEEINSRYEERTRELEIEKAKSEAGRIYDAKKRARIPNLFWESTFQNCKPKKQNIATCREIFKHRKESLFIVGDYGVGKTYMAVCILQDQIKRGREGYFITVKDLERELYRVHAHKEEDTQLRWIESRPVLVLDDIGIADFTPKGKEYFYDFIDIRYRNPRFQTIFTSKLNWDQLSIRLDGYEGESSQALLYPTTDRIKEMCKTIFLTGKSRRNHAK